MIRPNLRREEGEGEGWSSCCQNQGDQPWMTFMAEALALTSSGSNIMNFEVSLERRVELSRIYCELAESPSTFTNSGPRQRRPTIFDGSEIRV